MSNRLLPKIEDIVRQLLAIDSISALAASKCKITCPLTVAFKQCDDFHKFQSDVQEWLKAAAANPVNKGVLSSSAKKELLSDISSIFENALRPDVVESATELPLSGQDVRIVKHIVTEISALPEAELYLYPVDRKVYPEYYEQIKKPMDFATFRQKLSSKDSYTSLREIFNDLNLIWSNCQLFNAEGSDIYNSAGELQKKMARLFESKFGEDFTHFPKVVSVTATKSSKKRAREETEVATPGKKGHESLSADSKKKFVQKVGTISKKQMLSLVSQMKAHSSAEPFLYPVHPDDAPGYADVISKPMDLSTIEKNVKAGEYKDEELLESDEFSAGSTQFLSDFRLIWSNCMTYNLPDSDISNVAHDFGEHFEECLVTLCAAEGVLVKYKSARGNTGSSSSSSSDKDTGGHKSADEEAPSSHVAAPSFSAQKVSSKKFVQKVGTISKKQMLALIVQLQEHSSAEPFLYPVHPDDAPGYEDVISKPMDLSTIEKNVKAGEYKDEEPPEFNEFSAGSTQFLSDIRLIWGNCVTYNLPDSDISKVARDFGEFFEESVLALLKENSIIYRLQYYSQTKFKVLTEKKEDEEPVAKKLKVIQINTERVSQLSTIQKIRKVCETIYRNPASDIFKAPVTPGMAGLVKTPMDLEIVHQQVDTVYARFPLQFRHDMDLVWSNFKAINPEGSAVYEMAESMRTYFNQMCDDVGIAKQQAPISAPVATTAAVSAGEDDTEPIFPVRGPAVQEILTKPAVYQRPTPSQLAPAASATNPASRGLGGPVVINANYGPLAAVYAAANVTYLDSATRDRILNTLQTDVQGVMTTDFVVSAALQKTKDVLEATPMPFHTDGLTVTSWGTIDGTKGFGSATMLFPDNYCAKKTLELKTSYAPSQSEDVNKLPENFQHVLSTMLSKNNIISVELNSYITSGVNNETNQASPIFSVCLADTNTLVARDLNPLGAWKLALGKEAKILDYLGRKMRRCRSVLNRISASPDAVSFLEPIPPSATTYLSVVRVPMCLREVYKKLTVDPNGHGGEYDSEYEFAWDMRLIFRNALTYHPHGSELYQSAERLALLFEYLMCQWVFSVTDVSVDVRAMGPFDDWYTLKVFDAPTEPFAGSSDDTMQPCAMCQELVLKPAASAEGEVADSSAVNASTDGASTGLAIPASKRFKDLYCPRCVAARAFTKKYEKSMVPSVTPGVVSGSPPIVVPIGSGKLYTPCYEHGLGWCKSIPNPRASANFIYVSPMGAEVQSIDQIYEQKVKEASINEILLKRRQATSAKSAAVDGGNMEMDITEGNNVNAAAGPTDRRLNTKPITRGVLAELHQLFELMGKPGSQRPELVAYAKALKFQWIDPASASTVDFPLSLSSTGFFGLDMLPIKLRLEGLHGIERFALSVGTRARPQVYRLSCIQHGNAVARDAGIPLFDDIRRSLVDELLADKGSRGGFDAGVAKATAAVAKERFVWSKYDQGMEQLREGELSGPLMSRQLKRLSSPPQAESMAVDDEASIPKTGEVNMTSLSMSLLANDEVDPATVGGVSAVGAGTKRHANCTDLFLPGFTTEEGEKLLCVWDFLDATRPLIGEVLIGFTDVMKAVIPPPAMFPTISQVVFDELGCILAGLLHEELHILVRGRSSFAWQEMVSSRPVNIVTWPCVVHEFLSVILPASSNAAVLSGEDVFELMQNPPRSKEEAVMMDLLCLLSNHPLISKLLTPATVSSVPTVPATPFSLTDIKNKVMSSLQASSFDEAEDEIAVDDDNTGADADSCYRSLKEFINDVKKMFAENASSLPGECALLKQWFSGVLRNYRLAELISDNASDIDASAMALTISTFSAECCNQKIGVVTDLMNLTSDLGFGSFYGSSGVELLEHIQPDIKSPAIENQNPGEQAYNDAMSALGRLERTLQMLLLDDTETYSKTDRIDLLYTLVDLISRGEFYNVALDRKTSALMHGKIIPAPASAVAVTACAVTSSSSSSSSTLASASSKPTGHLPNLIMTCNGALRDADYMHEVPREPSVPLTLNVVPTLSDSVKCVFTGLGPADVDKSEIFVEVPPEFVPDGSKRSSGGDGMDVDASQHVYGLKSVLLRVAAAREFALTERNTFRANRAEKFNKLLSGEVMHAPGSFLAIGAKLTGSCRYLNSAPLGHDRHGCEYWMIGCQETYTLGCFNKIGGGSSPADADPALLLRDTQGQWFKLSTPSLSSHQVLGDLFTNQLSNDIPCERALCNAISDRLFAVKQRIGSGLYTYKNMQMAEWFIHQRTFEKWIHHLHLNMDQIVGNVTSNPSELVRLMELVFARCCESRTLLYYGSVNRDDITRFGDPYALRTERHVQARLKRFRDSVLEESAECHHIKGWQRADAFGRTREISCTTIASRLLSDPSLYPVIQFQMRRLRFRKPEHLVQKHVPAPAAVAPAPAAVVAPVVAASAAQAAVDVESFKSNIADAVPMKVETLQSAQVEVQNPVPNSAHSSNEMTIEERQALYWQHLANGGRAVSSNPALYDVRVTKGVEQLNKQGEVVHRYPSGKDAALSMQVSHGGISLCCTGAKQDAYGFLWRFYVGRLSDFSDPNFNVGPHIRPLSELVLLRQNCKVPLRPIDDNDVGSISRPVSAAAVAIAASPSIALSTTTSSTVGRPSRTAGDDAVSQPQSFAPSTAAPRLPPVYRGEQKSILVSSVLVNHKMAKLKAELLSVAYVFPSTHLRWHELQPENVLPRPVSESAESKKRSVETDVEGLSPAGAGAVVPTPSTASSTEAMTSSNTSKSEGHDETSHGSGYESDAESNEDTPAISSGMYPGSLEEFVACVQAAVDPSALMRCVLVLEDVLPELALVGYNPRILPTVGTGPDATVSTAAVGVRIFALDRSLKYEDCILDLRVVGEFAPRTNFVPKCMFTAGCLKPWCHHGRCGVMPRQGLASTADSFSRYEPIPEIAVHPSKIPTGLVYPPAQMFGSHVTDARQQPQDRRQSRADRDAGPRVLVAGSNYFANIEKNKLLAIQQQQQVQSKRQKGFAGSDSEEEMEDSDSDSDAGDTDEEEEGCAGRRLTRFDVDHDDIIPVAPRAERILRTAWV